MSRNKKYIIACKNGVAIGYVKSVSYARQKFYLTKDISEAKSYVSDDHIFNEIDKLTALGYGMGYIFTINA